MHRETTQFPLCPMKNTLSQLTPLAALLMLTGCFAPVADSEALIDPTEGTTSLKVTTRAAMGEVAYPVEILAYDISGELKARQTIENADQSIKLQLNDGQYHITALSGQGSYEASLLKKRYGGAFEDLNNTIELLGGEAIPDPESLTTSNNSRYLCEEGTKSFKFAESSSITTVGKKVKYRLRLVKKVHLIVK